MIDGLINWIETALSWFDPAQRPLLSNFSRIGVTPLSEVGVFVTIKIEMKRAEIFQSIAQGSGWAINGDGRSHRVLLRRGRIL
jgi:hypothetical protein